MPKIKVEIEVPNSEYCNVKDVYCPMHESNVWGDCHCSLFDCELETDANNGYYCKRCDKCKQAEVEDDK